MAGLLACMDCGSTWSGPASLSPVVLKFCWCNDCGSQKLLAIGDVPGVSRPPVHTGTSAPAKATTPPLLLTWEPSTTAPPTSPNAPSTVATPPRQIPAVNVLPAGTKIVLAGCGENILETEFKSHTQGNPFTPPPKKTWDKYLSASDTSVYNATDGSRERIYVRIIAIWLLENGANLRIRVPNPKGDTYAGVQALQRDMTSTLNRIAHGETIQKALNNAGYNNDGMLTSNKVKYDRYGKNFKGARPNSKHLPQPDDSRSYREFYVDRESSKGASPLSVKAGKPGVERLFLSAPDFVYYTWNHYGSDVPFGQERSNLTDADIWAVYSFTQKCWVQGLTR